VGLYFRRQQGPHFGAVVVVFQRSCLGTRTAFYFGRVLTTGGVESEGGSPFIHLLSRKPLSLSIFWMTSRGFHRIINTSPINPRHTSRSPLTFMGVRASLCRSSSCMSVHKVCEMIVCMLTPHRLFPSASVCCVMAHGSLLLLPSTNLLPLINLSSVGKHNISKMLCGCPNKLNLTY